MESTNKLTPTSKPALDELAFLSALAFLVPVGHPTVDGAAGIGPSPPILPSLSVSLTRSYFLQPSSFWKQCVMLKSLPSFSALYKFTESSNYKQSKHQMNYKQKKHQLTTNKAHINERNRLCS
jgi:hypothetical protein